MVLRSEQERFAVLDRKMKAIIAENETPSWRRHFPLDPIFLGSIAVLSYINNRPGAMLEGVAIVAISHFVCSIKNEFKYMWYDIKWRDPNFPW